MSEHRASVEWRKGEHGFARKRFSREHLWRFDGGQTLVASASPEVVPPPWSQAQAIDPEEAFVAAVASCHLMSFLFHAANEGLQVERYVDEAQGVLEGFITEVVLTPRIEPPLEPSLAQRLHALAHRDCFIARSIRSVVTVRLESGDLRFEPG